MKHAWNRLGSPDAISWSLTLLVSVLVLLGSLTAPFVDVEGRLAEYIVARGGSVIVTALTLGAGKLLLIRYAQRVRLPLLTLLIFVASSSALTISMNWILIVTGFTETWNLPQRLAVAVPGTLTMTVISALLVTYARDLAAKNNELASAAAELISARLQATELIAVRQSELIASIETEIERGLNQTLESPPELRPHGLRKLIDDVVRPMSYQLMTDVPSRDMPEMRVESPKISWREIFAAALRSNPAHPLATPLWLGLLMGAFFAFGFGIGGIIATLGFMGFASTVLFTVQLLWRFIPLRVPSWVRATIYTSAILTFALAPMPFLSQMTTYNFFAPHVFVGWVSLCLMMSWTITLVFAVNTGLEATFANLTATVSELRREVVSLNNEYRLLQKRISRVLHGPIQEAITASLLGMMTAPQSNSASRLSAELRERLASALAELRAPSASAVRIQDSFDQLVELWNEVVSVELDYAPSTLRRVENDPVASFALVEFVREACGNAIRHGDATWLKAKIDVEADGRTIIVSAANNGIPLSVNAESGLGSLMFDDICLSWRRYQDGDFVVVEARLPLSQD